MKHLYHPIALDGGTHFCIMCGATNAELRPTCPGRILLPTEKANTYTENLRKYGPNKWVISRVREDYEVHTLVTVGDVVGA